MSACQRAEGKPGARGLQSWPVHRDPDGELHRLSAVCAQRGCIVTCDPAAKSWDCPC
jgi:Rieske Fe-S protein